MQLSPQPPRRRKADQSAATRAALLAVARRHFGEFGFAATRTEDIVAEAAVTRGALYFHFKDKRDLFRALVESVSAEIAAEIRARAVGGPWEALAAGCAAFLAHCSRPDIRQIYLIDAPAVLGWIAWREIDTRHSVALLRQGVAATMGHAETPAALDAIALLLSGAMNEAALAIAEARDPEGMLATCRAGLERILDGLRRGV